MTAYYNEIDPFAAEWLRQLISAGHIAPGDVDTRSIVDVRPDDLRGYAQCHFFAGIGVWSHALRLAGWPDDRPVWTGSCPCQPFSAAGKGGGFDDERHLWPHFHWLISQCGPPVVLGEQVASKDGLAWLDLVQTDMETSAYAFGAVDTCAAGFGAPHIRQRLWWIAERLADAKSGNIRAGLRDTEPTGQRRDQLGDGYRAGGLADASCDRRGKSGERDNRRHVGEQLDANGRHEWPADLQGGGWTGQSVRQSAGRSAGGATSIGEFGGMADPDLDGLQGCSVETLQREGRRDEGHAFGRSGTPLADPRWTGPTNGLWRDADWLFCRDGKWRPVEPGTFPLAHGSAARVGRLRGYGNAIVAPAAQAFIEAVQDTLYPAIDIRLTDLSEITNDTKDIFA